MSGWSCRYQDGQCYCHKLKVGCRPGMVGCRLRGKERFTYDEDGRPIPPTEGPPQKIRSRRGRKVSA